MRNALGSFGAIGGAVVVTMAALYGFTTSDTAINGVVVGFFFAIIALGGVAGPAAVVHLAAHLRRWAKVWALPAALVVVCAIVGNLSNSLGALAGRADKMLAERANVADTTKDDRAELKRVAAERTAMTFTRATADTVKAARVAVEAAERTRIAECGNGDPRQRGLNCRLRETEEQASRNALSTVLANADMTEQAEKLDADAAAIRARLEKAQPVQSVNPLADALGHILSMPAAAAATWRDFFLVAIAELLIAGSLAAYEGLRHSAEVKSPPVAPPRVDISLAVDADDEVPLLPAPPLRDPSCDDVTRFLLASLKRARGATVTWAELYVGYRRWCGAHSPALAPIDPEAFGRKLDQLRSENIFRARMKGQDVHCLDVQLVSSTAHA